MSPHRTRRNSPRWTALLSAVLLTGVALVASGCATTSPVDEPYRFDEDPTGDAAFSTWIEGEEPPESAPESAGADFVAAEAARFDGRFEEAYRTYVSMLQDHSGHALNRYAVDRLRRLESDIPGFSARMADDLQGVRYDTEDVGTRVELARLIREVARDRWLRSDVEEPFEFRHAGGVGAWRATPMLSPWSALNFEEPMRPESTDRLSRFYRSPGIAGPDAANWKPTRILSVARPGQSPGLGGEGIYYLEARLEVQPRPETEAGADEPRQVTVSGDFSGAGRVWIGDELALDRTDPDYGSGHRVRRVALEPGDHRVLVKLGYRPGRADDFDLLFVPTSGAVTGDAGLTTHPRVEDADAEIDLVSEQHRAEQLEPVRLADEDVEEASDATLYLASLSAYLADAPRKFTARWEELMERRPEFVAGHLLGYHQARTRSDLPADLRASKSLSRLRRAQKLAPENLYVLIELERRLRDDGSDEEHRRILERARQAALQTEGTPPLRPLVAWGRYLVGEGWSTEAEDAWRKVLEVAPGHCGAARQLQSLYRSRHYFPAPARISDGAESCSRVVERWLEAHPDRLDERVEWTGEQARRHPWSARRQQRRAEALRAAGRREEAAGVLEEATDRMPRHRSLWNKRIELALGEGDRETARTLIDEATARLGRSADMEWQRARLNDELPVESLLRDGRRAALEEVRRTGAGDEVDSDESGAEDERAMVLDDAYYVVDFAGKRYFEDGSSWTLTHQIVRVMTRGAIDDYAEMSVPGGSELLVARTIKEDGEVRVPEGVTGDSTLSMPGLERGDMVEIAYLQFEPPSRIASRIDGTRFYFQMPDVSTRHSEYVVLGDGDLRFETANGAPEAESIEVDGLEGTRFVAEDVRRPRSESRRPSGQDYLPWVREVRRGVDGRMLEFERRYMQNAVEKSARTAPIVEEKFREWLGAPIEEIEADDRAIRDLYYGATGWFRNLVPGRFSADAAHALHRRRGSPLVVMHLALSRLGVDHDIYVARTDEQPTNEQTVGEIDRYARAVLRVRMPDSGRVRWLRPDRRTAMFGAVEPDIAGQNAICITCESYGEETVEAHEEKPPRRHVDLEARLGESGTLTGTMRYELQGVRAARVRAALRDRTGDQDRRDYFERILTDQLSGADLVGWEVVDETAFDRPLTLNIEFERRDFARRRDGELVVDRPLFRENLQQIYGRESSRTTPLFVGYQREQSYSVRIDFGDRTPASVDEQDVVATSAFGDFERRSFVEDGTFRLESSVRLPRQRVGAGDYPEFRDWIRTVEESGRVWMRVE